MFNLTYYGLEFFLCCIEVVLVYFLVEGSHTRRYQSYLFQFLLMMGTSGLILVKSLVIHSGVLGLFYIFIIISAYIYVQFKIEWKQVILYMIVYCLCCYLSDILIATLHCMVHSKNTFEQLIQLHAVRYYVGLMSKSLSFALILLVSRNRRSLSEFEFTKTNTTILCMAFVLSMICFYTLDIMIRRSVVLVQETRIDFMVCLLSLCIFSINLIVYWAIQQLNKSVNREKEYALMQYRNELLVKSAEENQELNNEWRRIRHDFNNHISCIDMLLQMGNVEKARAYIQKLTQVAQQKELCVNIGNEIANAVLSQKMIRAKNYKIQMNLVGELPSHIHLEDSDLCALLSNALDNAIEAACQIEEESKRQIELNMVHNEKSVLIKVSNSVKENIDTHGGLITTKKDTNMHGIGMRSMQSIVRKYSGNMSWKCVDKQFILSIVLPIE